MKLTRREFFGKTIKGAVIISIPTVLGSVLESCSKNNPLGPGGSGGSLQSINATAKSGVITLDINSSSPIGKVGGAALIKYQSGNLLVDRPGNSSFNALSAICTHQGCLITSYDSGNKEFICPCHGSKFNLSGGVDSGPAQIPLSKYQTSYSNSKLTIKV